MSRKLKLEYALVLTTLGAAIILFGYYLLTHPFAYSTL
jgi:predicted secreted protein